MKGDSSNFEKVCERPIRSGGRPPPGLRPITFCIFDFDSLDIIMH